MFGGIWGPSSPRTYQPSPSLTRKDKPFNLIPNLKIKNKNKKKKMRETDETRETREIERQRDREIIKHQPPRATDPPTMLTALASPTSNFKYLFSLSKPNNYMIFLLYSFSTSCVYSRHGKTVRLGRVNRVANQTGHRSKTGHFKRVKKGFRSIGLRVGSS